jgi:hypothetical protein
MKWTFKIKISVLIFFSSYFLTLLFNEGHANANVEDTSCHINVKTWLSKTM